MSQESAIKIKLKKSYVIKRHQYSQGFLRSFLHERQGKLSGFYAFILSSNSMNFGELLIFLVWSFPFYYHIRHNLLNLYCSIMKMFTIVVLNQVYIELETFIRSSIEERPLSRYCVTLLFVNLFRRSLKLSKKLHYDYWLERILILVLKALVLITLGSYFVNILLIATKLIHVVICMSASRINYLELTIDVNILPLQLTIRTFMSRRGASQKSISDNFYTRFLDNLLIHLGFILEHSPWFGGFYECLIGIVKSCIKEMVSRAYLTFKN